MADMLTLDVPEDNKIVVESRANTGCKMNMAQKGKFAAPFKTPPGNKITSFFSQQSTPGIDVSKIIGIPDSQNPAVDEPQPSCSHHEPPKPSNSKRTFTFKTPKQRIEEKGENVENKTKSPLVVKWPSAWPHGAKKKAQAKAPAKNMNDGPKTKQNPVDKGNAAKSTKNQNGIPPKVVHQEQNIAAKSGVGTKVTKKQTIVTAKNKPVPQTKKGNKKNAPALAATKATKRKAPEKQVKPSKIPTKKQVNREKQATPIKKKKAPGKPKESLNGSAPQTDAPENPVITEQSACSEDTIQGDRTAQPPSILESQVTIFPAGTQPPSSPGIPSYQVPKTSTPKKPGTPRTPRTPFFERMTMKSPGLAPLVNKAHKVRKTSSAKKAKRASKALKKSVNRTFPEMQSTQNVFEFTESPSGQRKKLTGKVTKKKQKCAEQEVRNVIIKMANELVILRQRRLRLLMDTSQADLDQALGVISMIQPLNMS